jgi:RNA polymerase sigma factor (sigma-70 family)
VDPLERYVRTGCQQAFAQIVDAHGRAVLIGCLHVLGNLSDAEDAAQEVFLALAQHPERATGNLAGWLQTVARRKAINLLQSRIARSRREEYTAKPEGTRVTASEQRQANVHEELLAALKRLPTRLREPVRLCYLEGRGQQEAARVIGCHQSNLCRRLLQGLGRLRSTLLRRGVVAGAAGLAVWLKTKAGVATAATLLVLSAAITVPLAVRPSEDHAQLQSFGKVLAGNGVSATGFSVNFGSTAQPPPAYAFSLVAHQWLNTTTGTGRYCDCGAFSYTLGKGTATTQQVIVTGAGSMYNVNPAKTGSEPVGPIVPIRFTLVVNLTATRLPLPAGAPPGSTANAATMTFRAVNAATGAQIVATDVTGCTLAAP